MKVTGIDLSSNMIDIAMARAEEVGMSEEVRLQKLFNKNACSRRSYCCYCFKNYCYDVKHFRKL